MNAEPKNYELAYLLIPTVSEEELAKTTHSLAGLIESAKGLVRHVEMPKKRILAYPVKKKREAYFGWITFRLIPERIRAIVKNLKEKKEIVRYLIVEKERESRPQLLRPMALRPPVRRRKAEIKEITPPPPEAKLDLEALDKKLEEILGK